MSLIIVSISFQINGKSVENASHEEAVSLLTSSFPSVTLIVSRERVLEKRMTPLSKHREESMINKRIAEKEMIQDAMIKASAEVRWFLNERFIVLHALSVSPFIQLGELYA